MKFLINKSTNKVLAAGAFSGDFADKYIIETDLINVSTITNESGITTQIFEPEFLDLSTLKDGTINNIKNADQVVNEIELANNLKFDDNQESLNYLQTKRATSNASEVVYDKYNTSETMTNAQLTTAVSTLATSIMQKDDEVKAKIVQINNAQSITEVQLIAGLLQERIVKLIVDVDGTQFDDVNQVTDEALNQVVMPASNSLDLSQIAWLNAKGIKLINGQSTSPQQIVDSNNVHTANVTFSADNPIVTGEVLTDGAPVAVDVVIYF